MKRQMMLMTGICLAGAAWAQEKAPLPPAVQAQMAAEFAKAKLVTEGLSDYERPWTLSAYVPNDRIVWEVGERPEAVFEVRGADGRLLTKEQLTNVTMSVSWYRTHETTVEDIVLSQEGNPVRRILTLDKPGVVAVTAKLRGIPEPLNGRYPNVRDLRQARVDEKGKRHSLTLSYRVGALFNPLEIKPGKPIPEGFDAKWREFLEEDAKYSNVPKHFRRRGTNDAENVWVYAGVLDSPGGEVHFDWGVTKVVREGKGKLPIRVFLQAYGTGFHFAETWISGELTLGINCHSISNRASNAYWDEARKRHGNFGFPTNENAKVETCYHINMLRRDIRALRWAMSHPGWDGTNLYVHGDSQGGFQTFALSGLFPQITKAWSMCPWYVDVGGSQKHWRPLWQPGPDFADPVHHITRTKAQNITYTFGICDSAGPADGMMAMFNGIPDTTAFAEITIIQNRGHDAGHTSKDLFPHYVFTKRFGKVTGAYHLPTGETKR